MNVDWKVLVDVRERQRQAALEAVVREREAADAGQVQAQLARDRLQLQMAAKAGHWQSTAGLLAGGDCSVAQLRQAGSWSRVLDREIAQAGQAALEAQAAALQRQQALEQSRRLLRAAAGELEKARQMQQRCRAEQQRLLDVRRDDATEDAAAQAWAVRRPA